MKKKYNRNGTEANLKLYEDSFMNQDYNLTVNVGATSHSNCGTKMGFFH